MIFHFTFFCHTNFSGSFGTFNTDSPRSMSPGNTVSWTLSFKKFGSGTYFSSSFSGANPIIRFTREDKFAGVS